MRFLITGIEELEGSSTYSSVSTVVGWAGSLLGRSYEFWPKPRLCSSSWGPDLHRGVAQVSRSSFGDEMPTGGVMSPAILLRHLSVSVPAR